MTEVNGGEGVQNRLRVLIIGGYGTFGGRLVELLADEGRLTLLVAGRSLAKARAFCERQSQAQLLPVRFDRMGDPAVQLGEFQPDIVVDASGPFQAYGDHDDPYRIVHACLAADIDYLDLADASAFVAGIRALDSEAKTKGRFALSGVSSFPVLTCAVVRAFAPRFARIESVRAGIAPSPYAGVGLNVIRAIASYAGQSIPLRRNGRSENGTALVETMRVAITVPGKTPLRPVLFSLVDVPDLRMLPEVWPELREVWVGAGPVPESLHRALIGLSRLVSLGLMRSLSPLAPLMSRAINLLRWGPHRGGMFVHIGGRGSDGTARLERWHMIAEAGDGPMIPSMAAEAIIRHCLDGRRPLPGARSAHADLELADYDALFARREIFTAHLSDAESAPELPLYRRLLGAAYDKLPAEIARMHELAAGEATVHGRARVEGAKGLLARLVGWLFRFPTAGEDIPVSVTFTRHGARERWKRSFAGRRALESWQEEGTGANQGLLVERFGPFSFGVAILLGDDGLSLQLKRWTALGLPMPQWLAPRFEAREFGQDGRFHFDVAIRLPLIGQVTRYQGWLTPPKT